MARRPDTPCALCGTLLWSGRGTLPEGRRICQPCRRISPQVHPRLYIRKPERTVACVRCGSGFTTTYSAKRYCSAQCRWNEPKRLAGIRHLRNGRPYRRLREQVLAEEQDCWLCEKPLGAAPWPDPLSGTIDHIVPVSVDPGRILDRSNVRAAHLRCNSRRSDFQFGKTMLVEKSSEFFDPLKTWDPLESTCRHASLSIL